MTEIEHARFILTVAIARAKEDGDYPTSITVPMPESAIQELRKLLCLVNDRPICGADAETLMLHGFRTERVPALVGSRNKVGWRKKVEATFFLRDHSWNEVKRWGQPFRMGGSLGETMYTKADFSVLFGPEPVLAHEKTPG